MRSGSAGVSGSAAISGSAGVSGFAGVTFPIWWSEIFILAHKSLNC